MTGKILKLSLTIEPVEIDKDCGHFCIIDDSLPLLQQSVEKFVTDTMITVQKEFLRKHKEMINDYKYLGN